MSGAPATAHAARPPFHRLVMVETRKMLDTRASMWLLIITGLGVALIAIAQAASATGSDAEAGSVFQTAMGISSILLPIIAILLVTSEFSQRSGLITFALVPQRGRVIAAKAAAAFLMVVAGVVIGLVVALICGGAFGNGSDISGEEVGNGALYLLINVAIGTALGLLFMNSPLAIVLLFAAPIVIALIGAISTSIGDVTEWIDTSELQELIDTTGDIDWGKIAATVAFWVALPFVAGWVRLRQTDID